MYEEEEDAREREADDQAWMTDWRVALEAGGIAAATRRHQRAADGFAERPALFPSPDPVEALSDPHRGRIPADDST